MCLRSWLSGRAACTGCLCCGSFAPGDALCCDISKLGEPNVSCRAPDTDLSGTLDVGEFRDAMRRFGEEMDGRAVGARRRAVNILNRVLPCAWWHGASRGLGGAHLAAGVFCTHVRYLELPISRLFDKAL